MSRSDWILSGGFENQTWDE